MSSPGGAVAGAYPHSMTPASLTDLPEYVAHFRARLLQDALAEALAAYWLRRAEAFAAVGTETCDEIARACRNRAKLALGGEQR